MGWGTPAGSSLSEYQLVQGASSFTTAEPRDASLRSNPLPGGRSNQAALDIQAKKGRLTSTMNRAAMEHYRAGPGEFCATPPFEKFLTKSSTTVESN